MVRLLSIACAVLAVAVAALAMQVHDTQRRLDALEAVPSTTAPAPTHRAHERRDVEAEDTAAASSPGPAAASAGHRAFARGDGAAAAAGEAPQAGAKAGVDEGRVSAAVRTEIQKLDDEKQQAREDRQRARLVRTLDKLQASAGLSDDQKAQLQTMLDAESVELRQMFADARDGDGDTAPADLRDKVRAVREKTDENAAAVLGDDTKKAAYQAMRDDERSRFFGGRRGGGP